MKNGYLVESFCFTIKSIIYFVLQGLADKYEATPRYWTSGGQAEVDFIIQRGNDIIPIEVKADQNVNSRSLTLYGQKYEAETKIRLRFS